jgi:hypothetical protein
MEAHPDPESQASLAEPGDVTATKRTRRRQRRSSKSVRGEKMVSASRGAGVPLPPEKIRTRETDFADVFSGVGQTNKQRIALSSRRQYGAVAETTTSPFSLTPALRPGSSLPVAKRPKYRKPCFGVTRLISCR